MKVLLVDDDRSVRVALAMALEGLGVEVRAAVNGEEGLRLASTQPFDWILSDINMPGMDGFEFGRRLRSDPVLAKIPLVYMTGSQPLDLVAQLALIKADGLLRKPIGLADLSEWVERHKIKS